MLSPKRRDEDAPRPSLVADAYKALKDAIRDNVFPPGYQGSEQEIATRLGMSRTPVHEAVIRLQEEGLIRVLTRRGVVVCGLSAEDMGEIYEVLVALEGAAAELLARMGEPERLAVVGAMDAVNRDMERALDADDLTAWAKGDEAFHRLMLERCGNGRLHRMFLTVMDQSHRARMLTLRLRPKPVRSAQEHRAIVVAIAQGEAEQAAAKARAHRLRARDELVPLLAQIGIHNL
jgi:DNA-binding GntR family transcriptional regulator